MKLSTHKNQLFFLGLFLFMIACAEKKPNKHVDRFVRPNVVLFIADDVSWNDLGCYGNSFVQTPNIDKLAESGMKFTNAILTTSSCSPSRISIMTGRYPHNTGAAELHTEPKVDFESIASVLKNQGYHTGQAGKWHMGELLKKGFDKIYEKLEENGDGGENKWISSLQERDREKPFFFWFAPYDAHRDWGENKFSKTHNPYQIKVPPTLLDNHSTRIDLAKYYDEIRRFDFHVGEVVKELKKQGVFKNTLIIVMADNGRPFPRDKTRMYDSGMKTPFIIHWPDYVKEKSVSHSLISSVDIAPTILDVCQTNSPRSFQGTSFNPILTNPKTEVRDYTFSEHNWHDHEAYERMVRTKDYLYISNSRPQFMNQGPADALNSSSFKALQNAHNEGLLTLAQADIFLMPRPEQELYRVKNDPFQLSNLIGRKDYTSIHLQLKDTLLRWMNQTGDTVPENLTEDWYTRDTGEKIESNFEIRGEMPGESLKADTINRKF